jgi:hypothetical protein
MASQPKNEIALFWSGGIWWASWPILTRACAGIRKPAVSDARFVSGLWTEVYARVRRHPSDATMLRMKATMAFAGP